MTTATRHAVRWRGYAVGPVAGFDDDATYAAALDRALDAGLRAEPGPTPGSWVVANPTSGRAYLAHPRYGCSCPAHGPCKHLALAALLAAIRGP